MHSDSKIHELLHRARTVAIVGMSDDPSRASHAVARFLQRNGYRIIPVNPRLTKPVLGERPVASLRDIDSHVDIVNIFRQPEAVPEVVEDAIAISADTVWMPLGVVHHEAATRAEAAGLAVVMDRCIAIDFRRLNRYAELMAA